MFDLRTIVTMNEHVGDYYPDMASVDKDAVPDEDRAHRRKVEAKRKQALERGQGARAAQIDR
jgi:hypothetical protein